MYTGYVTYVPFMLVIPVFGLWHLAQG